MNMVARQTSTQVLAVLDDAAAGLALLELSSALARSQQRGLSVVYVESTRSLLAATLPFAKVLPHAGSGWLPLRAEDIERGYRAQAARLRELAARVAIRDALSWSMRVTRGSLSETALALCSETDLLLLCASAPVFQPGTSRGSRRRPVVKVVDDGSDAAHRALQVAAQLVQLLAGVLEVVRIPEAAELAASRDTLATLSHADLVVLPRRPGDRAALTLLRGPVLLVS
jgi:nucleotide-binding universal stress UspA family protein